jgi:hypothetical protein
MSGYPTKKEEIKTSMFRIELLLRFRSNDAAACGSGSETLSETITSMD